MSHAFRADGPQGPRRFSLSSPVPRARWTPLALACLFASAPLAAHAGVIGLGDVAPGTEITDEFGSFWRIDLPFIGGPVDGDIIVGGTGIEETGTTVGSLAIDTPASTDPLTSTNAFIGGLDEATGFDGMGEAIVSGFGSEWSVDNLLVVGNSGVGYLSVLSGALVESDVVGTLAGTADTIVGQFVGSQGYVTVNGFGSRLIHNNLVVGERGFGRVEAFARARIETRDEAIIGGDAIGFPLDGELGVGYVLLDGRGTRWNIGDVNPNIPEIGAGFLTVGEEGRGALEIRNQALVVVENDTRIGDLVGGGTESFGQVYINGQDSQLWNFDQLFVGSATTAAAGELHLDNLGTARADASVAVSPRGLVEFAGGTLLTPTVTNDGVMRGFGRIEADVVNNGFIRNAALTANLREYLKVTGVVDNNDNIESFGGEMEFESIVNNVGPGGDIVGIDAIFRFNAGVNNTGNVFLDNTVVWSPGTFTSSAALVVQASTSTLLGDLALTDSNSLFVELGDDYSRLEVSHGATIDGTLRISLGDEYVPRAGDAFEIIEAGSLTGVFDNVFEIPALSGFDFDVTYSATSVVIRVDAGFVFNADWDGGGVGASDLAIWEMNFGMMVPPGTLGDANGDGQVDGADFNIWQQQLGTMPIVAAGGAVPEPATAALVVAAIAALPRFRRRSS